MSRILKSSSLLIGMFLTVGVLLSGCTSDKASSSPNPETSAKVEQTVSTETKCITISVLNLSNVQIGMFAVIDPATGEQINLDQLEPGLSVSMECNWPTDVSQFQWALYNMNGELCIESSTDISEAEKSVALVLTGDNTIENVQTLFDKGDTDSE